MFKRPLIVSLIALMALPFGWLPAAVARDIEPVYARNAMVASPEPHAAEAGIQVLKAGGNAFDAAAAIGFALAVTFPTAGNLGGGGFLTGLTADGERFSLDFREMAPGAAYADMFLDEDGDPDPYLSRRSLLASGVPGTTHGLLRFQRDYGRLPRAAVLNPAIRLAERGFEVPYTLAYKFDAYADHLRRFESTEKIFYPNGEALEFGETLVQRDLGLTLRRIRDRGAAGFYEGETAQMVEDYMKANGGIITAEDMKNYISKYREPFQFSYKDYELFTIPLPSSGGLVMGQALYFLEDFDLASMGHNSARYVHTVAEAERIAFADRAGWMGDTDFVDVPVERMMDEEYLNERRRLIPDDKAGTSEGVQPGVFESEETTHFCVVDEEGNVAAITYTLNGTFGMGAVVEGAGFLLNNEMDDFTAKPGVPNMFGLIQLEANKIEPGKRMLSAMTPTIVMKDGEFESTMGTPGGPTIITTNIQIFLNRVVFGMNMREAIDAGRFHHQWLPDRITHEPAAFTVDTARLLEEMGHELSARNQIGFACGIERLSDGVLAGYSDGRGEGLTLGY